MARRKPGMPLKQNWIELAPGRVGTNPRAAARPRFKQPFCGEDLERLPEDGTAHTETGEEDLLARERIPRKQRSTHDFSAEVVRQLVGQGAVDRAGIGHIV